MSNSLWGITTFFNPTGYRTKRENYRIFRGRSRAQGLPLVTVELAFGDRPFELEEGVDAEVLVRRRSSSVLWQKERLLNIALEHLPSDARYVCWVDADVLFENDDWVGAAASALEAFDVIQPFRYAIRLPKGGRPDQLPSSRIGGFRLRKGTGVSTYSLSWCSEVALGRPVNDGTTGYAWCGRRDVLERQGFYDRCITGGGDRELALAFTFGSAEVPAKQVRIHHRRLREDIARWRADFGRGHRVSFLPGAIHHLWHGDPGNRQYKDRHALLEQHDFDPTRDIALDDGGCWQWSTHKGGLVEAVRAYFDARREDG